MALRSYRYTPSRSTGITNIIMACGILGIGITAAVRGEMEGGRGFFLVWVGLFVAIIAGFVWRTFVRPRSTRILLPSGKKDRWSDSELARSLGKLEPEDDDRRR